MVRFNCPIAHPYATIWYKELLPWYIVSLPWYILAQPQYKLLVPWYTSKVKLRLLYCHPPQLRPATPGL